jgi:hypothetical protein
MGKVFHPCRVKTLSLASFFLVAIVLPAFSVDPKVDHGNPETVARVFYSELRRLGVSGLPGEEDWAHLKPFCSETLGAALDLAVKEQIEFMRKNPDEKPPWIEGDLFSSLFEGPKQFVVGGAVIKGETAEVPVECTHTEGGETVKWSDTLLLVKEGGKWLIDDVSYGGTWDFANSGTLKEALDPEEDE